MESALYNKAPDDLKLFETMRWTPDAGVIRQEFHLERFTKGCVRLGIAVPDVAALLSDIKGEGPLRLRLSVGLDGEALVEQWAFSPLSPDIIWNIAVAEERVISSDPWLRIKTSERALYDRLRRHLPEGIDELIVLNERGEVCEGTITNIFVDMGEGLVTPPLSCGLLPGVLRAEMLARGEVRERVIFLHDLARAKQIFLGNSLRGKIRARYSGTGAFVPRGE